MSQLAIRRALETRLAALTPALATAWENQHYTPAQGTPFQAVALLPAQTQNPVFGGDFKREVGLLQVLLHYPTGTGAKAANERADSLKAHFPRGLSLTSGGVIVIIEGTPSIAPARDNGEWYMVPVSIPYFSNIAS